MYTVVHRWAKWMIAFHQHSCSNTARILKKNISSKNIRMTIEAPSNNDCFLGIVLVARQLSTQARPIFQFPSTGSGVCPSSLYGIGCTEFGKFSMPAQWLMNRKLEFEIELCGPSIVSRMYREPGRSPREWDHLRFVSFPCDCAGLAPSKADVVEEAEASCSGAVTAFNIVFVFQSSAISDDEAELYWQALATISRAIIAEELRAGFLTSQVHRILNAELDPSILGSLNLVSILSAVYHGVCSSAKGVSLYVNDSILTHITVNPFSEAPPPPAGHQSLLLTCNADQLQSSLPVDSASNVRRLIDAADPTKTIKEHMVELGLPMSTIQRISQHLVYWKKARVVHPLNKRIVLAVSVSEGWSGGRGVRLRDEIQSELIAKFPLKNPAVFYSILHMFSLGKKLADVKEELVEEIPALQNRFNELCIFLLSHGIISYSMPYFRYFPPNGIGPRLVSGTSAKRIGSGATSRPKFQNQLPHEIRCQYSPLEFDVIFDRLRNNSTGSELMIKLISNYVKKHRDILTARIELNEQFRCTNDDFHKLTDALSGGFLDSLLVKYECDI